MNDLYVVISETQTNDNKFFDSYTDALIELKNRKKDKYFGNSKHWIAKVMHTSEEE